MKTTAHLMWFLVACSDAIADLLVAVYFFRVRRRFGLYMAWFMVAVSIEAMMAAFSLIVLWPGEIDVAPTFAIFRTIGRTIKMIAAWVFLGYLFYWINGDLQSEATRTPDEA